MVQDLLNVFIKTTERRQCNRFGVFVKTILKYFPPFSRTFIVDFEQINVCWDVNILCKCYLYPIS